MNPDRPADSPGTSVAAAAAREVLGKIERLARRGDGRLSRAAIDVLERRLRRLTVAAFVLERCDPDHVTVIGRRILHNAYEAWSDAAGLPPIAYGPFLDELVNAGPFPWAQRPRKAGFSGHFVGISLRPLPASTKGTP